MARFALIDPHARRAVSVGSLAPVVVACGRTPLNVSSHVEADAESDSVAETEFAADATTGSDCAIDMRVDAVADRAPDTPLCNGRWGFAPLVTYDARLAAIATGDFTAMGQPIARSATTRTTPFASFGLSARRAPSIASPRLACYARSPCALSPFVRRRSCLGFVRWSGLDIFADVDANVIADSVVDSGVEPTTETEPATETMPATETEPAAETLPATETMPATELSPNRNRSRSRFDRHAPASGRDSRLPSRTRSAAIRRRYRSPSATSIETKPDFAIAVKV